MNRRALVQGLLAFIGAGASSACAHINPAQLMPCIQPPSLPPPKPLEIRALSSIKVGDMIKVFDCWYRVTSIDERRGGTLMLSGFPYSPNGENSSHQNGRG